MTRYRCALLAASALAMAWPQQGLAQSTVAYTYDALGRVLTSNTPAGVTTYTYDTADNRTHVTTNQNHPPVANNDSVTTAYQTAVTFNPISNDTDPDAGDTIQLSSVGGALNGHGTVTSSGNNVTFTPAAGYSGPEVVGYVVSDSHKATAQGVIYVTVNGPNHPPVANADTLFVNTNTAASLNPLANDTDQDGDAITISSVGGALNGKGTVSWTPGSNTITFTPNTGASGAEVIGYWITDGKSTPVQGVIYVTINSPPTANNDSLTATVGGSGSVNVLANDSDPNGDPLHITSVGGALNGKGTVTWDGASTITFTPNAGASGSEVIGYWVGDNHGGVTQGIVYVTINRPPVAGTDYLTVPHNTAASINPLTNDSDPDGDTVSLGAVGGALNGHGTVTKSGNTIIFTPTPGYTGGDLVGYFISDGRGGTAQGTIWVSIQ